ncbi:MAG TPA: LamG domain-containing protein, partial [Puia sp.]|nr:LamG domain-containing protein [Puia sp.]
THDTVTVTKVDTLTDTLYATKPDPTVNLNKGLLLYLPFSGNIADSSGNNNPTQAVGSVLTYDAHGYANSAFGGTGHGEKIYVTNNGSIQFDTAYTLSFGFMVSDTVANQTFFSMIEPTTGVGPSFFYGNSRPSVATDIFGTEDITLGCDSYGKNDNYNLADTTTFSPLPNAWYNAICVYHKGTNQVYINGKLISTKTGIGTSANLCPASKIIIGAWWDGDPQSFTGKLDNFRLYNRVLTPNEIVKLSSSYQVTSNSVRPVLHTN